MYFILIIIAYFEACKNCMHVFREGIPVFIKGIH